MSPVEATSIALGVIGIGLNIYLALISPEWRDTHKSIVSLGHWIGLALIGIGAYLLLYALIPSMQGDPMFPKVSILFGVILAVGGMMALFVSPSKSQGGPSKATGDRPEQAVQEPVVGLDVYGNGQSGPALDIQSNGTPSAPSIGSESTVYAQPGQSAIGTRVIQNGPGTGMRVIQNGPGVGFRSTVIVGNPPEQK